MKARRATTEGRAAQKDSSRRAYENGGKIKQRARIKAMKENDPFRWKCYLAKRYDRSITIEQLKNLWQQQAGLCAITGRALTVLEAELDHVIPRSRGGSDGIENLRWVCGEANDAKRALLDEELLVLCRDITRTLGRRIMELNPCRTANSAPSASEKQGSD